MSAPRLTRRSFLQKLSAVVAASVVAPQLLERAAAPAPAVVRLIDREIGISIRFIRQFDATQRLDVLYGVACVREPFACRVEGA